MIILHQAWQTKNCTLKMNIDEYLTIKMGVPKYVESDSDKELWKNLRAIHPFELSSLFIW